MSGDESKQQAFSSIVLPNEDALLQLLVRTPAADHGALRCVCKSFRRILCSASFRRERMLSEWAEVEASLFSARELKAKHDTERREYEEEDPDEEEGSNEKEDSDDDSDEDFYNDYVKLGCKCDGYSGVVSNNIRILVDGLPAGSGELTIIRRTGRKGFHEYCEIAELEEVGLLFFDDHGRPQLESVKQALLSQKKEDRTKYFLYLEKFVLNREYRQHTWVGACALRSVLLRGLLKGQWSVVIYDASASDQSISENDDKLLGQSGSDCDEREEQERDERWEALTKVDLRQFLRAGFKEPKEAVSLSSFYHAFCVPSFLETYPMPSHQEAVSMAIVERPPSKSLSRVNARFFSYISDACIHRRDLEYELATSGGRTEAATRRNVLEGLFSEFGQQDVLERRIQDAMEASDARHLSKIRALEKDISKLPDSEGSEASQAELEDRLKEARCMRDADRADVERRMRLTEPERMMKEKIDECPRLRAIHTTVLQRAITAEKEEFTKNLLDHDAAVKSEISKRIKEGATVEDSMAVHACLQEQNLVYVEALLDFVDSNQRRSVINGRSEEGLTPLMVIVIAGVGESDREMHYRNIEKLIDLGADKNAVDPNGETALGKYRSWYRILSKYRSAEDRDILGRYHERFERLLRPIGGATAADDAALAGDEHGEDDADQSDDY